MTDHNKMRELARKGGAATKKKYGSEHYSQLGRRGHYGKGKRKPKAEPASQSQVARKQVIADLDKVIEDMERPRGKPIV